MAGNKYYNLSAILPLPVTVFTYVCRPVRYIQRPELRVFRVSCPHTLPVQYILQAVFFMLA